VTMIKAHGFRVFETAVGYFNPYGLSVSASSSELMFISEVNIVGPGRTPLLLHVFDIKKPENPELIKTIELGEGNCEGAAFCGDQKYIHIRRNSTAEFANYDVYWSNSDQFKVSSYTVSFVITPGTPQPGVVPTRNEKYALIGINDISCLVYFDGDIAGELPLGIGGGTQNSDVFTPKGGEMFTTQIARLQNWTITYTESGMPASAVRTKEINMFGGQYFYSSFPKMRYSPINNAILLASIDDGG
jgi:hypothetical protein